MSKKSNHSPPHNPHDKLFKKFLSDKSVALEFFESYLPAEIKNQCNLDTLQLTSSTFIEPNLKAQYNDILYSVETKLGEKGYVYFLVEHQSTPDKRIGFRLMRYTINAIQQHLEQHPTDEDDELPLIFPILFYAGKTEHPKTISLNWLDLFKNPTQAKQTYTSPFWLVDLQAIDDNEIKKQKKVGILMYLLRDIRTNQLIEIFKNIAIFVAGSSLNKELLDTALFYAYNNGKVDNSEELENYLETNSISYGGETVNYAQQLYQNGKKEGMNYAQQLYQNGKKEGIEQGIMTGRTEGITAGRQQAQAETTQAIARNMLQNGGDVEFVKKVTGLTDEEIKKLQS